jgi:tetratricopeptide (TPR) repeat protein
VAEEIGDLQTIAHLLTGLSIVSRELGDLAAGQHYAERGLAVYEALDSIYGRIQGLLTLGGLALAQKEYLRSQPAFERALALSRSISLRTGEADSHYRLGQVALAQGDEGRAASHLRQALQLATTMQEVSLIFDALYATVNLLVAHPSPAAVDLMRWLIDRKEIDDQRRSKLTALFAFSDRNDRTESRMSINEAVGLAIELITPDDTTLDWGYYADRDYISQPAASAACAVDWPGSCVDQHLGDAFDAPRRSTRPPADGAHHQPQAGRPHAPDRRGGTLEDQAHLEMVRELGAPWIVEYFPWAYVEEQPGRYNWTHNDLVIDHANRQGLQVIARLGYVPQWARPAETSPLYLDEERFADFAASPPSSSRATAARSAM